MTVFEIFAALVTLAAVFSYLNHARHQDPDLGRPARRDLGRRWRCPSRSSSTAHREVILAVTYSIVVFSIVVQGLTVGPFVRRCLSRG